MMKHGIPFLRLDVAQGAPDAAGTARMLGARADGLDLATREGMLEEHDVAKKLARRVLGDKTGNTRWSTSIASAGF